MKKKEAVRSSIEQMDARLQEERLEQERQQVEKRKDVARPSLLKRIGAGILDFIFAGLFAGAIFLLSYFTIFPSLGYQQASKEILSAYTESTLFVQNSGSFEEITKHYDETKTPEANYDKPIIHYYSTDSRAIAENKLDAYNNKKLNSSFYEQNDAGEIVRKEGVANKDVLPFLEGQYTAAVDFFYLDPVLIANTKLTYYTMSFSILIVVAISSAIFYFLIPLLMKKRQTLGYLIFKLIPVTGDDMEVPNRGMIALRSFVFVILTFISPISVSVFFTNGLAFAFIPFFANTMILSFSRSNSGLMKATLTHLKH